MADKSKNKADKVKNLKKKLKKLKLPLGRKSLLAALIAPGVYQGVKDLDMSDLKLLDITDQDVRELYSQMGKETGEKYSGWKGKAQAASDIAGTIWDFSPFGFLTDPDIGFGSKTLGAGTLDNYSPEQLKELQRKAMLGSKVKRKKGSKVIKLKTKKNKKTGRPKGVGCATKGYGKAMKRGK